MTNSALGSASAGKRTDADGRAGVRTEVAELVRHCSNLEGRRGFRVVARGVSGHIFFERGRVVHAEFGEDCGLRAVVEMLRAGPAQLETTESWPSQPSLHLGPELLLSMTSKDASRVVRKIDLPGEPPPLPDPTLSSVLDPMPLIRVDAVGSDAVGSDAASSDAASSDAVRAYALHSDVVRAVAKRPISGVMPRVVGSEGLSAADLAPASIAAAPAPSSVASQRAAALTASRRSAALAASRLAASVAVSERAMAKSMGSRPPPAPMQPLPSVPPARPVPAELPITRAQKARSRSIVVSRSSAPGAVSGAAVSTAAVSAVGASRSSGAVPSSAAAAAAAAAPTLVPPATRAIAAPSLDQPTTMVRIASRGELLAARGKNAEQLAEAAAFIHGLANLIAADFGRHGRANVHLSGGGLSLLVARSEVNDIAAALGPTARLTSLLGKVGFK